MAHPLLHPGRRRPRGPSLPSTSPSRPPPARGRTSRSSAPSAATPRRPASSRPALMPMAFSIVVQDGAGALDVAGRAGAHHAGVLALRLQREEAVEGRDAVHLRQRHAQVARELAEHLRLEVAVRFLRACAAPRSASAPGGRDGASSPRRASSGCPWRAAWVDRGSVAMMRLLREHRRDGKAEPCRVPLDVVMRATSGAPGKGNARSVAPGWARVASIPERPRPADTASRN